ncbi:MAG: hypothetical protein ACYDD4_09350 [Acidimicrobiales bacterium]
MLSNHDDIVAAIHGRREVLVTWPSKDDDGRLQTRRCAPMDYGPGRISNAGDCRYHFWDFESDSGQNHNLSLRADQISEVTILDSIFDPADFVTWTPRWVLPRGTWGRFS